jgi:hypothetical protein
MPLAKCPRCDRAFHIDRVDPDSWYATRWPHLLHAEFLPELCWSCRREPRLQQRKDLDSLERKVS